MSLGRMMDGGSAPVASRLPRSFLGQVKMNMDCGNA